MQADNEVRLGIVVASSLFLSSFFSCPTGFCHRTGTMLIPQQYVNLHQRDSLVQTGSGVLPLSSDFIANCSLSLPLILNLSSSAHGSDDLRCNAVISKATTRGRCFQTIARSGEEGSLGRKAELELVTTLPGSGRRNCEFN